MLQRYEQWEFEWKHMLWSVLRFKYIRGNAGTCLAQVLHRLSAVVVSSCQNVKNISAVHKKLLKQKINKSIKFKKKLVVCPWIRQ